MRANQCHRTSLPCKWPAFSLVKFLASRIALVCVFVSLVGEKASSRQKINAGVSVIRCLIEKGSAGSITWQLCTGFVRLNG